MNLDNRCTRVSNPSTVISSGNPLMRGLLGLAVLSGALFALPACTRETTALDESVALCGERHDARPGQFGLVPRLASDGSFIRTFSATLHRGGTNKPLVLSNSRGCVFVDRNATGVLVVTGDAQGQPIGGRAILDGKQDKILSQITLAPLASPERFKACGEDGPRPAEEIRVLRADESPVLARDIALLDAAGNPLSAATRPAITPLGCVGTTRAPSFVVASQAPAAQAYVGEDERRAGLVRLDERLEPGLTRACATNFSESQRERIVKGELVALVTRDATLDRSTFHAVASKLPDWSACSKDVCEAKDWLPLGTPGGTTASTAGACIVIARSAAPFRVRSTASASVGTTLLSKLVNPTKTPARGQSLAVPLAKFVAAEALARSFRGRVPQCFTSREGDRIVLSENQELRLDVSASTESATASPSSEIQFVLRNAANTEISRSNRFELVASSRQTLSWSPSMTAPSTGGLLSEGLTLSVEIIDLTGRTAVVALDRHCTVFAERPEAIAPEKTLLPATTFRPKSFVPLFDSVPDARRTGVRFAYRINKVADRGSDRSALAAAPTGATRFDDQKTCLADGGLYEAPDGIVQLPGVGRYTIEVRGCALSGAVVHAEVKPLDVDGAAPTFSLRPGWRHMSVESAGKRSVPMVTEINVLGPGFVQVELFSVADDVLSFQELLRSVQCEATVRKESTIQVARIASCEVVQSNAGRGYAVVKIDWELHGFGVDTSLADNMLRAGQLRVAISLSDAHSKSTQWVDFLGGKNFSKPVPSTDQQIHMDPNLNWATQDFASTLSASFHGIEDEKMPEAFWSCVFEGDPIPVDPNRISLDFLAPVDPPDDDEPCFDNFTHARNPNLYALEWTEPTGRLGGSGKHFTKHWQSKEAFAFSYTKDRNDRMAKEHPDRPLQTLIDRSYISVSMGRLILWKKVDDGEEVVEEVLWNGSSYQKERIPLFRTVDASCPDCEKVSLKYFVRAAPMQFILSLPKGSQGGEHMSAFEDAAGILHFLVGENETKIDITKHSAFSEPVPISWHATSVKPLPDLSAHVCKTFVLPQRIPWGAFALEPIFKKASTMVETYDWLAFLGDSGDDPCLVPNN